MLETEQPCCSKNGKVPAGLACLDGQGSWLKFVKYFGGRVDILGMKPDPWVGVSFREF